MAPLEVEREPQGRREGWHRREEQLCDVGCGWIWHKAKQGGAASNKEKKGQQENCQGRSY